MIELSARATLDRSEVTHGDCRLSLMDMGQITQIMPFKGHASAVEAQIGMKLPQPNGTTTQQTKTVQWFGRGTYLLIGAAPAPQMAKHAAISDQSDGWSIVSLQGAKCEDVLARLVPVDVRLSKFGIGQTARTLIQHMNGALTRTGTDQFELMVMRSMTQTLWHDVERAMQSVAQR
ncbi:sarcosine oxidase subunit gamma [Algirhabdus cladophorae]|uniref:sarcosine oxidase subunit gamma n=1 Tax=Algirhabdus cladophorae TaxID=3377108 RepID=UPI003B848033